MQFKDSVGWLFGDLHISVSFDDYFVYNIHHEKVDGNDKWLGHIHLQRWHSCVVIITLGCLCWCLCV